MWSRETLEPSAEQKVNLYLYVILFRCHGTGGSERSRAIDSVPNDRRVDYDERSTRQSSQEGFKRRGMAER